LEPIDPKPRGSTYPGNGKKTEEKAMAWRTARRGTHVALTPPTRAAWIIAVILGTLGILVHERLVQVRLGFESFWLVVAAFVVLAVAALSRRF